MTAADAVARRSLCVRAQVGCVIVTLGNRVQAACYNGPAPTFDHQGRPCSSWCPRQQVGEFSQDYSSCVASHAEASAIARSDWSSLLRGTVYVTGSVCINCARIIAQTGISRVVHRVTPEMAYRQPELVEEYLAEVGIEVVRY